MISYKNGPSVVFLLTKELYTKWYQGRPCPQSIATLDYAKGVKRTLKVGYFLSGVGVGGCLKLVSDAKAVLLTD